MSSPPSCGLPWTPGGHTSVASNGRLLTLTGGASNSTTGKWDESSKAGTRRLPAFVSKCPEWALSQETGSSLWPVLWPPGVWGSSRESTWGVERKARKITLAAPCTGYPTALPQAGQIGCLHPQPGPGGGEGREGPPRKQNRNISTIRGPCSES